MALHVFVYGTLRRGGCNHARMAGAEWLGPASVRGRLYELGWYPGLVIDAQAGAVHGDVFKLASWEQLAALDHYEGCSPEHPEPHEYRRERTEVLIGTTRISAWLWVWRQAQAAAAPQLIATGDWLAERPLGRAPTRVDQPLAAS
jgi:gamma-glutamylcyclotransferase (GGCT)/AIG2-like uncharacterized protein YtfP